MYIYLLKRRPDETRVFWTATAQTHRKRESVGDQSVVRVFVLECASHFWRLFPGKSKIKTRANAKLRGKAEHTDTHENESRLLRRRGSITHSRMSTPQFRAGNPLAPEKGAFPLDHFGECATFKETYLKCLQVLLMFSRSMLKRDGITRSLILNSSSFTRSKWWLYINVKTETKIGREQV